MIKHFVAESTAKIIGASKNEAPLFLHKLRNLILKTNTWVWYFKEK